MGLLNSNLFDYLYQLGNPQKGKVFAEIKPSAIKLLPIKIITNSNKKVHDEIVKHVDSLLKLNEELKEVKIASKAEQVKQRIAHSEERINELVYGLYDLTPDEIKIIENQNG